MTLSSPRTLSSLPLTALAASILTVAAAHPAAAQVPGHGPTVLDRIVNPRALALGSSWAVNARDSDLIFANPALVVGVQGIQGALGLWGSAGSGATLSGGGEWWGGSLALGLRTFEADDGAPLGSPAHGESQWAGTLAWAREFFGVQVGAAGHLFRAREEEVASTGGAFDVGLAREAFDVMFSLAATNLGPSLSFGGEDLPLPYRITLAANSQRAWVGPLDVGGAAAVAYRADGEWIPSAGVEVAWWPVAGRTFVGRTGYRRVPEGPARGWTVGGGFEGDRLTLDYAWQGYDAYDGAHFIGIRWR